RPPWRPPAPAERYGARRWRPRWSAARGRRRRRRTALSLRRRRCGGAWSTRRRGEGRQKKGAPDRAEYRSKSKLAALTYGNLRAPIGVTLGSRGDRKSVV